MLPSNSLKLPQLSLSRRQNRLLRLSSQRLFGGLELLFNEIELNDQQRLKDYRQMMNKVLWGPDCVQLARDFDMCILPCNQLADDGEKYFHPGHSMNFDSNGQTLQCIPGEFVFEWMRPQSACAEIHPIAK